MKKTGFPRATAFSKSQINRYGDVLRLGKTKSEAYEEAFSGVSAWRAAHLYPLNTFRATLTRRANLLNPINHPVIAQRLKRMPTIINKLQRNPGMELSRMQDVGGLRAIVDSLKDVYTLKAYYEGAKISHKIVNQKDYIREPKLDGYRGIHLVFKYAGLNPTAKTYDGMLVEMQIRTKLQHTWATAVEVAGVMLQEKLKNDMGNKQWLKFFRDTSKAFELIEYLDGGKKYVEIPSDLNSVELYGRIYETDRRNKIVEKLESFSKAMNFLGTSTAVQGRKYFLIILDPEKKQITIQGYSEKDYEHAIDKYRELEELHANTTIDQVLVSAGNLKQIKIAYPNYFADISDFVSKIRAIEREYMGLID